MPKIKALIILTLSACVCLSSLKVQAFESTSIPDELRGDGTLSLFRPDKNERETFHYRDAHGFYDAKVFEKIAHFFRCRLTEESHPIDPGLIEILDAVEDHFGRREIRLISAYRSPLRNAMMRSSGRRVAKDSLHMYGMASDIEVAGVPKTVVRNFAYSIKQGGIGYYGSRTFVHVDTGPLRTWGWTPPATSRVAAAKK